MLHYGDKLLSMGAADASVVMRNGVTIVSPEDFEFWDELNGVRFVEFLDEGSTEFHSYFPQNRFEGLNSNFGLSKICSVKAV